MAKTNVAPRRAARDAGIVTHEGATAKRIGAEAQLRRTVMACLLWEDTFYEDGRSVAERVAEGVAAVPLEVAAQVAVEARNVMHLRHVPLLVAREMARRGGPLVGRTIAEVVQRADELAEFLAIYWREGRRPLSAQVKKGLAEAFTKFSAYQLAKYNRDEAVKLRDVLFLVHPRPLTDEMQAWWDHLVAGTLPVPDTWETSLSGEGRDKRAKWARLLEERKLGGLALLRNLRNMQQAGVDEGLVRAAIADNEFRRVLPFRFIAAAKHAPRLEDALEQAMFRAAEGMPQLPGKTALLVDHSGSMDAPLSARSELTRIEAAAALAVLVREVCETVVVVGFSTTPTVLPPRRGFALAEFFRGLEHGSTNTESAKQLADREGYDRIIVVTDEQSHQSLSDPKGRGYVVNVAAYRNGIGYGAWTHIDGWSEGIVRYIQAEEAG